MVLNKLTMPDLGVMDTCSTVAYRRNKDRPIDTCMFLVFCKHLSSLLDKCLQILARLFAYIYFGKSLFTFIHMLNIYCFSMVTVILMVLMVLYASNAVIPK